MPTPATAKWAKPKSEDEFEDIVVDFARLRWKDPNAQRFGRRGQRQYGVDVVGRPPWLTGGTAAAQCKNTDALTLADVIAEVAKAKNFPGGLAEFYVVTSGDRDAALQSQVRAHFRANPAPFDVEVVFWPDVVIDVSADDAVVEKYWKGFARAGTSQTAPSGVAPFGMPVWIDRDGAKDNELTECHSEFVIWSPGFAGLDSSEMTAAFEHASADRPKDYMSGYLTRQNPSLSDGVFGWSKTHREYTNVVEKFQMEIRPGSLMVRRWSTFSTQDLLLFETRGLLSNVIEPLLTYERALTETVVRSYGDGKPPTVQMRLSVFASKRPKLHDNGNIVAGPARYSSPASAETWQVELKDELQPGAQQVGLRLLNRVFALFRYDEMKEPSFARDTVNRLVRVDEEAYRASVEASR